MNYFGKRMLLIAPVFFGYYREILKEAEGIGMKVQYICDAPSNTNFSKALGRVNKNLVKGSTKKYFEHNVLPLIEVEKFDYVFVVAGMTFSFTPDMVKKIRESQPNAKFVMYQWDSEKNLPYSTHIHQYFDRLVSFDRFDCIRNSKYVFLPLFYIKRYADLRPIENVDAKYDCAYIGTAHPQKYRDVSDMAEQLTLKWKRQFIYHYMPSKLKYLYHKLTAVEFRKVKLSNFETQKMSTDAVMQIFEQSRCILDAPQAGQTGLTIRTIECLGAKRKLITTNPDIVNYDFYKEENIYVYNGKFDFSSKFFTEPYKALSSELYDKYALKSWLQEVLCLDEC